MTDKAQSQTPTIQPQIPATFNASYISFGASHSWSENLLDPTVISIAFLDSLPATFGAGVTNPVEWNGTTVNSTLKTVSFSSMGQISNATLGIKSWASVANFTPNIIASTGKVPVVANINIIYGKTDESSPGIGFFKDYTDGTGKYNQTYASGYLFLNAEGPAVLNGSGLKVDTTKLVPGTSGYWTFLHEFGHTLGLAHTGGLFGGNPAAGAQAVPDGTGGSSVQNNWLYTVMSYRNDDSSLATSRLFPITPMMYDIAAVQALYGASASGYDKSIWKFTDDSDPFSDISGPRLRSPDKVLMTIWDENQGLTDSIDTSGVTETEEVSLIPGTFSSIGLDSDTAYNVGMALGTFITVASLGSGGTVSAPDVLFGNNLDDSLTGGAGYDQITGGTGNDTVVAGAGHDTLTGGGGTDTYVFNSFNSGSTAAIINDDGNGSIKIGGTVISGEAIATKDGGKWTLDGFTLSTTTSVNPTSGKTTTTLLISDAAGDQITIPNYVPSFMGILLGNQVGIESSPAIQPFRPDNFNLSNVAVSPAGNATDVTIDLAQVNPNQATNLVLTESGGTGLIADLGSGEVALNGSIDLVIPAGQSSVSFELVDTSTSQQAQTVQLTTSLANDGASDSAPTNTLTVNFSGASAPVTGTTISDTSLTLPSVPSGTAPLVTANFYRLDSGNDVVTAGSGTNIIGDFIQGFTGDASIAEGTMIDSNILNGAISADSLHGTADGNDTISGGGGQDVIAAGNGNNQIYADAVVSLSTALSQAMSGTASNKVGDLIFTGNGNNTIVGGTGNDQVWVGSGNNTIVMGAGANQFFGGVDISYAYQNWPGEGLPVGEPTSFTAPANYEGVELSLSGMIVPIGTGNDTIYGGTGSSTYELPNGNNYLDAGGGNDSIWASTGNNTIYGGAGNDTIDGGGGNDNIYAEAGSDMILGQGGNTTIIGGTGNDTIFAGDGNDSWASSITTNNSSIDAGNGNTLVYGAGGNDTINGGTGNDSLYGGNGSELITAGDGNTSILGGSGNDTLSGGGGNDTIFGGTGNDTIIAGDGNSTIGSAGGSGDELILGGAGNDILQAGSGSATITGGDGNTTIQGGAGTSILTAGDGNTSILAGSGSTTIAGGIGSDTLFGGANTSEIDTGDGGTDAAPTQAIAGSGDTTINGGAGVDIIQGGSGNDVINLGDGGDATQADDGIAGSGDTTIIGGNGIDSITGGDGDDSLVAGDGGTTDNPTSIVGGSGSDTMVAGGGVDIFNPGSGQITYQVGSNAGAVYVVDANSSDVLQFQSGVNIGDITIESVTYTNGDAGVELILSSGGTVYVEGGSLSEVQFGDGTTTTISQLLSGQFAIGNTTYSTVSTSITTDVNAGDGDISTTPTPTGNRAIAAQQSSSGAQGQNLTLYGDADLVGAGNNQNNVITANSGNDTLIAGIANNTLIGGGASDDYMVGAGTGTSTLIEGSTGNDMLIFATGVSVSSLSVSTALDSDGDLDVTLQVAGGGEIIIDGALNSTVNGGDGSSTMLDTLFFADGSVASLGALVAQLATGPTAANSVANVTLAGGIQNMTLTGTANISATGNGQDNVMTAGAGNDTLIAGTGDDTLVGSNGHTTYQLSASDGNVVIESSGSGDTLAFDSTISENDLTTTSTVVDGVTVVTIVDSQGGTITINGGGLNQISFADGNATLAQLLASSYTNGTSTYSNVSATAGNGIGNLVMTGDGDVTATANAGVDTLVANSGNDTLIAGTGVDTLVGGGASDNYVIANGDQTTTIENSSGEDTITFGSGVVASALSATATTALDGTLVVTIQDGLGGTVVIDGYGPTMSVDQISFANGSTASLGAILAQATTGATAATSAVNVTVDDGIQNMQLTGNAGITATANDEDDVITANSGNDTLVAGAGNDTFVGGAGSNNYSISAGDGNLVINDSSSNDVLAFDGSVSPTEISAVSTTLNGQTITTITNSAGGTITINGGGLNQVSFAGDTISLAQLSGSFTIGNTTYSSTNATAGDGITTLVMTGSASVIATGNGLNDTLVSNAGNDTLIAGTGSDTLVGGAGNTTYEIQGGYGTTTIEQAGVGDTLVLPTYVASILINEAADGTVTLSLDDGDGMAITINGNSSSMLSQVSYVNYGTTTVTTTTLSSLVAQMGAAISTASSSQAFTVPGGFQDFVNVSPYMSIVSNNGNDMIVDNSNFDTLTGGSGNDTLIGGYGDTLVGGSGNELIEGGTGQNILTAGSGNDTLVGAGGNETLTGGSGNVTFEPFANGSDGNITIVGSTENEVLLLPSGSSVYSVSATLTDGVISAVTLSFSESDTTATIVAGSDGQMLDAIQTSSGTYSLNALLSASTVGETAMTASTSTVMPAGILNLRLTGYADVSANGNNLNDYIAANGGNDTLVAGSGNDTLVGDTTGPDGDTMVGGAGSTTYVLARGNLEIDGSNSTDTLSFLGNYFSSYKPSLANLTVSVSQNPTTGADVVTMGCYGAGTVTLDQAQNGQMVGNIAISSFYTGLPTTYSIGQIMAQATSGITAMTSATSVSVLPESIQNLALTGSSNLSAAGNSLDDVIAGNAGQDTLTAGSGSDTLLAGTGNDTLVGDKGNTTYEINMASSGMVTTTIEQSQSSDTLDLNVSLLDVSASTSVVDGETVTTITAGSHNTIVIEGGTIGEVNAYGGELSLAALTSQSYTVDGTFYSTGNATMPSGVGTMVLLGNANITATASPKVNNTITSNQGNDTLIAGTGGNTFYNGGSRTDSDTYVVNVGDGSVAINNCDANDVLQFGAGITATDLTVTVVNNAIVINDGQGGAITINSTGKPLLNQVDFADGTSITLTQLFAATAGGTQTISASGETSIPANAVDITLTGNNAGLAGNALDDTIILDGSGDGVTAGTGLDTLIAASGASGSTLSDHGSQNSPTTFVIDANSGATTAWINQYDALDFGPGITAADVTANITTSTYSGTGWQWNLTTTQGATLVVESQANNDLTDAIITFADGTTTTFGQLLAAPVIDGINMTSQTNATLPGGLTNLTFTGNADVTGVNNNDDGTITGNAGSDTLTASGASETLIGGAGNETLTAGGTNDVIDFANGYNLLTAPGANDILSSGSGVATVTAEGNNDTFSGQNNDGSTNNTLTFGGNNDTLNFYDGIQSVTLSGGNDTVNFYDYFTSTADPYQESAGVDNATIVGGGGSNIYSFLNIYGILNPNSGGNSNVALENTSSSDVLDLPAGLNPAQITASSAVVNGITVNTLSWEGGSVSVSGGLQQATFYSPLFFNSTAPTEILTFSDLLSLGAPVVSSTGGTLGAGVTLYGLSSSGVSATANSLNDYIAINSNSDGTLDDNDTLISGTGNDTLDGSGGYTGIVYEISVGSGTTTILPNSGGGTLQFEGSVTASSLTLTSSTVNGVAVEVLEVAGANPVILVGNSVGTIQFADGSSTSVEALLSTISSSSSIVMPAGTTNLTLTGTASITGTGNSSADTITANSGNDTLIAGSGLATLIGGGGNDTFVINNTGDVITEAANTGNNLEQTSVSITLAANVQNLAGTGGTAIKLTGNSLNNVITANSANDTLVAGSGNATLVSGTGNDSMTGGAGNDTFVVNNTSDKITVSSAKAGNVVQSSVTFVLPTNLLNLTGIGSNAISLTGNASADTITANSGNDTLTAGSGLATLIGGAGNDTFVVNSASDVITVGTVNAGNIVQSTVSYTLAANLLSLAGTSTGSINLTGNTLADTITANSGNDTLTSGTGVTTLIGGAGNDTFIINNSSDAITASTAKAGNVTQSTVSYVLPANLLNLTGTSTGAINLTGNTLADTITANSGNDTLTSGTGIDTLVAGTGNDTFIINNSSDAITVTTAKAGNVVQSAVTYVLPTNLLNLTGIGSNAISLTGNASADTITANSGNDTLTAGSGLATLIGGSGNDTFIIDNTGDVITEAANTGNNLEQTSVTITLAANVQNLTGTGSTSISLKGNSLANVITANSGNDTLQGGTGASTLVGGTGNDTMTGSTAATIYQVNSTDGNTVINSSGANDVLSFGSGITASTVTASSTGTGSSTVVTLTLSTGKTVVLNNPSLTTVDFSGASASTLAALLAASTSISSSVSITMPAGATTLTLTGTGNISGTGNTLADTIIANSGNDTLIAGSGNDTLISGTGNDSMTGGAGNDTFVVNNSNDKITVTTAKAGNITQSAVSYVLPTSLLNLTGTGSNNISLTGNASADTITANSGNDTLTAGSGLATLIGGSGNDTFIVNSASDVITVSTANAANIVQSSVSDTLGANLLTLTGTSTGAINLTGNTLADTITANSGNDTLTSGTGIDTLIGGAGNDTFVINNSSDAITVTTAKAGNVTQSSVSYVLPANLLSLTGTSTGAINLTGNTLADTITANSGNDTLTSGTGIDTLVAGTGNDTFIINNSSDAITVTTAKAGNVTQSSVNYVLPANLLNLTGTGTNAISLTGNASADTITANSGNDTLTAGSGLATLIGGAGNDLFIVNSASDVITEAANTGNNTEQTSVTVTLATNVQNLTGSGSTAIKLTGNTLNNVITGNSGNDTLVAGAGNDTLTAGTGSTTTTFTGGAGNDVFNVNSTTDVITAVSGTNVNTINSSVSYTAPTNVQDLFLTGTGSLTATANSGNDMLIGNSGTDTLTGGTGVDVLEAGSGADTLKDTGGANALIGGAGNDTITGGTGTSFIVGGAGNDAITLGAGTAVVAFNTGAGKATIAPGTGVSNVLSLGGGIDYANLAFSKSGNNLILSTGGNNTITFTNWYVGSTDQNFVTLQVIEQAASTYSSTSSNTLYSSEVEEFSFTQLVAAFNAALAATPSLTSWSLSNSLLTDHLSSSNTVALGGDLAYYDGLNGNLTGLNLATAVTTLQSSTYGKTAQTIDAWSGISGGTNKLH